LADCDTLHFSPIKLCAAVPNLESQNRHLSVSSPPARAQSSFARLARFGARADGGIARRNRHHHHPGGVAAGGP